MPRMPAKELKVIDEMYQLILWSCQHIASFPRPHRFTLGERMERQLYDLLDLLLRAKYRSKRLALLNDANLELEILRFQFRLAKDLRCLTLNSYGHASACVESIGKLIGGWVKACSSRS